MISTATMTSGKNHRTLGLTIALLFLSLSVVNWGLQYKMSLYGSDHSAPKASVAKLWTGSKDHSASTLVTFEKPVPLFQFALVFSLLALFVALCRCVVIGRQDASNEWKLCLAIVQRAYLFRPPPALA